VYALCVVQLAQSLFLLANQHLFATGRQLGSVPYLEESVALFEESKKGFKSRDMIHYVIMMIGARGMLADCYYKLGRYDDAAAMAMTALQACKVRPHSCPRCAS
jgi:hypothetical protein